MTKRNPDDMYLGEEEQLALDISGSNSAGALITDSTLQRLLNDITDKVKIQGTTGSQLLDPKKQVVVSNRFIVGLEEGSRFAYKLSRVAIGQIPMDAKELPITIISAKDIEAMGMTRQRLTSHIREVTAELLSYRISLADIDKLDASRSSFTAINVFILAQYFPGEGAIAVQLNPYLRDHFLNLKADFTQYALPVVTQLPGFAAAKLHELLLSRARKYGANLFRFRISDLTQILNYKPKGEFKPSTFVNSVIKRAVQSINENTACRVWYKAVRTGKSYTDVRFWVEADWKTAEEKTEYMQWEQEKASSDPMGSAIITKANEVIESRLNDGKDEIYLAANNGYITPPGKKKC